MKKPVDVYLILICVCVVGAVINPASSAVALLLLLGSRAYDQYHKSNIADTDRAIITAIQADVAKIKVVQERQDLGKAFVNRNG